MLAESFELLRFRDWVVEGRSREYLLDLTGVGAKRKGQNLHLRVGSGGDTIQLPIPDEHARPHRRAVDYLAKLGASVEVFSRFLLDCLGSDHTVTRRANCQIVIPPLSDRELFLQAFSFADCCRRILELWTLLRRTNVSASQGKLTREHFGIGRNLGILKRREKLAGLDLVTFVHQHCGYDACHLGANVNVPAGLKDKIRGDFGWKWRNQQQKSNTQRADLLRTRHLPGHVCLLCAATLAWRECPSLDPFGQRSRRPRK